MRVSRLALGTMTWGRDTDAEEAATELVAFVDAGGTFVDTADVYNDGESERILGKLLTDLIPRDEVVLATGPGADVRIARADITEMRPGTVSVMPAGLEQQMTKQELADLLAFLTSTKWGPK